MAQTSVIVIPAKAGIQLFRNFLDPGLRRGDGVWWLFKHALRGYLKMAQTSLIVIPAKAGIQVFCGVLDAGACPGPRSGARRGDGVSES
jgi:hypothetical protein